MFIPKLKSLASRLVIVIVVMPWLVVFPSTLRAEMTKALSLRVEEGYDSNVFLQKITPLANKGSLITTVQPGLDIGWASRPFTVNLSYQPRISIFHQEDSETNVAHAAALNFQGTLGEVSYEFTNSFTYVQGSRTTPIYTGPGGIPAIAAYQLRDRRESSWMKQAARVTWTHGSFFLRPVYFGYLHDFMTDQKPIPGYVNYVDRNNFGGGIDLGLKVMKDTWLVGGYRAGSMNQAELFGNPIRYSNTYQRALLGVEGRPVPWLKLNAAIGPSFHHFDESVPEVFGRNHTRLFVDATATIMPTSRDSIQFLISRFEQLSSCGRGAYEDIIYRAGYSRKFTDAIEANASFRLYRADFEPTAVRDDYVYTLAFQLNWKLAKHLTWTTQYSYEWAESAIPNTEGREYAHNLVSTGLGLSF